jgi:hypothetical protein
MKTIIINVYHNKQMSLTRLVNDMKPIVYIHTDEDNFPSSVEYYLNNINVKNSKGDVVLKSPTQSQLYDLQKANVNKESYSMHMNNPKNKELIWMGDSTLSSPFYAYVKSDDKYHYITYIFFYPRNGWYDILGLDKVGSHNADIEHITIEVDKNTSKATRYYYAAHTNTDGTWYKPEEIQFEDGHPVSFSAVHGHGSYIKEGIVFRLYGLANDKTNKGYKWDPNVVIIYEENDTKFDPNTQGWIYFSGDWSPDGIVGVAAKKWYKNGNSSVSKNPRIIAHNTWRIGMNILKPILIIILFIISYTIARIITKNYKNISFISMLVHVCIIAFIIYYLCILVLITLLHKYAVE